MAYELDARLADRGKYNETLTAAVHKFGASFFACLKNERKKAEKEREIIRKVRCHVSERICYLACV
jgi:hypothetical protein